MDNSDNLQNEKIVKKGFLNKKSKYLGNWKKRYIVLTENYIFAYTDDTPGAECTMNLTLSECFGPKHLQMESNDEYGFCFCNDGKIYCFKTNSLDEKNEWINTLRESLSH